MYMTKYNFIIHKEGVWLYALYAMVTSSETKNDKGLITTPYFVQKLAKASYCHQAPSKVVLLGSTFSYDRNGFWFALHVQMRQYGKPSLPLSYHCIFWHCQYSRVKDVRRSQCKENIMLLMWQVKSKRLWRIVASVSKMGGSRIDNEAYNYSWQWVHWIPLWWTSWNHSQKRYSATIFMLVVLNDYKTIRELYQRPRPLLC